MKIYHDILQGSTEWLALRSGKITGSPAHKLITPAKLGLADNEASRTYYKKILRENNHSINFDLIFPDKATTWEMRKGIEEEPEAKEWWAEENKLWGWRDLGFIEHDSGLIGISADYCRLEFGNDQVVEEGLEVKCPQSMNGYFDLVDCKNGEDLRKSKFEYWVQCELCMYVTGLDSWNFLCYVNAEKRALGARCNQFVVEKEPKIFETFDLILANLQKELSK